MSYRFNVLQGSALDIAWKFINLHGNQLHTTNRKCRFCYYEHDKLRVTLICLRVGFTPRIKANEDCGHPTKSWKNLYWCYKCDRVYYIAWQEIFLTSTGWRKGY